MVVVEGGKGVEKCGGCLRVEGGRGSVIFIRATDV